MDSIFSTAYNSITEPMEDIDFTVLLSKVTSQIGDGHIRIIPPKSNLDSLDNGNTMIPFKVNYYNDKLFTVRNYSELSDDEFIGSEIISINGHLIYDFVKVFLSIFPSDGNNMTHKYRLLSNSRIFTRYFYLLYGYTEKYLVEYKPVENNEIKTVEIKGLSIDKLIETEKTRYPETSNKKPIEFTTDKNNNLGYLRITSFNQADYKKNDLDFTSFLENSFKFLEENKINNLILDLRNNGGGTDEYGKILYSYFTISEFEYYSSLKMKNDSFNFFKYTEIPGNKAPEGMLKPDSEGSFDVIQHPNLGKQQNSKNPFIGNVYVLINGGCFSTTSEFLSMLHNNTKAVFIGEESGGGYYGNCSGLIPEMTLPDTKVRVNIPLMHYSMNVRGYSLPDRGIIPNHLVLPSINDIINNVDTELEFAKKLILEIH
ncbi:MAG: S41 family peptidase [Ignavibacteria bacterium]